MESVFSGILGRGCYKSQVYSEPCRVSKMELFAEEVNGFQLLPQKAPSQMLNRFLNTPSKIPNQKNLEKSHVSSQHNESALSPEQSITSLSSRKKHELNVSKDYLFNNFKIINSSIIQYQKICRANPGIQERMPAMLLVWATTVQN